jgi:hypothetical protein
MKVYYAIAWLWMMKLNNVKIGCLVLEAAYAVCLQQRQPPAMQVEKEKL